MNNTKEIRPQIDGETAVIYAGDYINKITGEKIERECKRRREAGCKTIVLNFKETEIVNSIGISILLGVIDVASQSDTSVIFAEVGEDTTQLFELLGLTNHVTLQK